MRNKKGFTLIELLVVIAILGIISMIAIPNIVGLSTGVRKEQMLADAKELIALAKNKVNSDFEIRNRSKTGICNNNMCTLTLAMLNVNGNIEKDPDGGYYDASSKVIYRVNNGTLEYCVVLIGSKRSIGSNDNCVSETNLYSKSNVVDNTPPATTP